MLKQFKFLTCLVCLSFFISSFIFPFTVKAQDIIDLQKVTKSYKNDIDKYLGEASKFFDDLEVINEAHIAIIPMKMMILTGTQQYLEKSVAKSVKNGAKLIIIVLDTPGGVVSTTQDMIQTIFKSPIPVVVYVAPTGAMAASAGTFLTLAGHIAVMAPGTSIGAAHPVQGDGKDIDGDMRQKTENMTIAMIKAIADRRNRNTKWAEKSIKESSSLTCNEALKENAIDLIAEDVDELLKKIAGRKVEVNGKELILEDYSGLKRILYSQSFKDKIINFLASPNIVAILWFAATTGLALELYHPGAIFPGVVGIVSLFLALGVSQIIPVSSAGVMLIIIGALLLVSEVFVTSGVLACGGIVAMVMGGIYLIDEGLAPGLSVSLEVIIPAVLVLALFVGFIIFQVVKAFTAKEITGGEGMLGQKGQAVQDFESNGRIFIAGEYWNAVKDDSSADIKINDTVEVVAVNGLVLKVKKI